MASDNFVQPAIPRFDGHYDHWSMLMENFLRSKEYWQVISEGIPEVAEGTTPTDAQKSETKAFKLKDLKAKNYLFQVIDRSILETILCKDTSKEIWDSMKKKFQGSARAKRQQLQALRTEFETYRMKSGESFSDFFSRTLAIVGKMRAFGEKIEDVDVVEKILYLLTPKFNYVVCAIEESKNIDLLSIDELQGSLLVQETKLLQQDNAELALKVSSEYSNQGSGGRGSNNNNRGRGRGNYGYQQNQHQQNQHQDRGRGRGGYRPKLVDKTNVECYRCHEYGHYKSECPSNLSNAHSEASNFAENEGDDVGEILLLMVCHERESTNKNLWYLDTGCSNHMNGDKSVFSILD
ncbi:uncharacterized protein [Henckelia pumila]|uniref:uncharacterized protein n=1 Tax=Henckelia pumila TaxID=405737 RepID=UPI003C6E9E53